MAKKVIRPKIKVQAVYSGNRDIQEVFVSLLVDAVRRGDHSICTFENVNDTQYNTDRNQIKGVT